MTVPYSLLYTSLSLCVLMFTLGCSGMAPTVERVDFKDAASVREYEKHPFLHAWFDPNVNWEGFKGIYVAPVNNASLEEQAWWNTIGFEQDKEEVVNEVSRYLLRAIQGAVADDPAQKFSVEDKPGPDILILDLALIELVPTNDWFHPSVSLSCQSVIHESVAMEGRILEVSTGRVIALFSGRQVSKQELVTMRDSDWSSHIHDIMDNWANQISDYLKSTTKRKDESFLNFRLESIGKVYADLFSKLSSVPRFRRNPQ